MRRFSISALRDYGMGKSIVEDKITEECSVLTKTFETYEGELVFPRTDLPVYLSVYRGLRRIFFRKICQELFFMDNCYIKLAIKEYRMVNSFQ